MAGLGPEVGCGLSDFRSRKRIDSASRLSPRHPKLTLNYRLRHSLFAVATTELIGR